MIAMKKSRSFRKAVWLLIVIATICLCFLSVKFENASRARIFFERCNEPITYSRIMGITMGLEHADSGNSCINHLRQIEGAKHSWALEHKKADADLVAWKDLLPYLKNGTRPWCPRGGIYRIGRVDEEPKCSYRGHELPKP